MSKRACRQCGWTDGKHTFGCPNLRCDECKERQGQHRPVCSQYRLSTGLTRAEYARTQGSRS